MIQKRCALGRSVILKRLTFTEFNSPPRVPSCKAGGQSRKFMPGKWGQRMKDTYIIYCLDGGDGIKIPIHSTDELFVCLQRIKAEALPVIDGIFSADVVIGGLGRISVGLDSKCILTYTSEDFEETLTSLGNETAQGETVYYFGDYTFMSNKYVIPYEQAMEALKVSVHTGKLSENIKWTDKLF